VIEALEPGDVLMVTRLDRLARSTRDLLNTLAAITEKKAGFRSLGDVWADTTTSHGRLMLTVLGGLAEFERDLIRARTGEGRARAKANGKHLGRPFKLACALYDRGGLINYFHLSATNAPPCELVGSIRHQADIGREC
jgi:DNA invertase Pin-like site-specific DNA recombinase